MSILLPSIIPQSAWVPLPNLGIITLEGPDPKRFLQGQLSCDLKQLSPTQAINGIYANTQGKIIATVFCVEWQQRIFLILSADLVDTVSQTLRKYAIFSKLSITIPKTHRPIMGLIGAGSDNLNLPAEPLQCIPTQENCIAAIPGITPRYLCLNHAVETSPEVDERHWQLIDILSGISTIDANTTAKFFAHRINLDKVNALNFEKGCYLGQEIIARMHYRATIKHHARIIQYRGPTLLTGDTLLDPSTKKSLAEVVNHISIDQQRYALITLADQDWPLKHFMTDQHQIVDCETHPLPYTVDPIE